MNPRRQMRPWLATHWLVAALVTCLLPYLATRTLRSDALQPLAKGISARAEGPFERGGEYRGQPLVAADQLKSWGSWSGSDANESSLSLGPFLAPARFRLGVSGHPRNAGIGLYLESSAQQRQAVNVASNPGERWEIVEIFPPAEWVGQPIRVVAVDAARDPTGWLAVTEPIRASGWQANSRWFEALAVWALQGLLLGIVYRAASRWLAERGWLAEQWIPLGAGAVMATLGAATFWVYFVSATAGKIVSFTALVGGGVAGWGRRSSPGHPEPGPNRVGALSAVPGLMAAIGFFYLALLHLFPTTLEPYTLAANRFCSGLPGDNSIPHELASRLFEGKDPRATGSDWLSSDRPPLQSGWQLVTWSTTHTLGFDSRVASAMSGIWFQLWWVAGMYGLLRTLAVSEARTCAWLGVSSLSGFFVQNTVFTWPKLAAGAFALGAFGTWALTPRPRKHADYAIGALFAALAWLAHGGVAFSFVVLLPWIAWRAAHGEWRDWLRAAAVFAVFALPWAAYQHFYDPPGNRLLKWHLAGQIAIDPRGTMQTLRESYAAASWTEIWRNKAGNLATQVKGPAWPSLFHMGAASLKRRHSDEFFFPLRAMTWWPLAAGALAFALWRRHRLKEPARNIAIASWVVATTIVWCLLMFSMNSAVVHQGSYAVLIATFALCCAWFESAGRGWLVLVALLQGFTFVTTWGVPNSDVNGPATGLPFVVLGTLGLIAAAWPRPLSARGATPAYSS